VNIARILYDMNELGSAYESRITAQSYAAVIPFDEHGDFRDFPLRAVETIQLETGAQLRQCGYLPAIGRTTGLFAINYVAEKRRAKLPVQSALDVLVVEVVKTFGARGVAGAAFQQRERSLQNFWKVLGCYLGVARTARKGVIKEDVQHPGFVLKGRHDTKTGTELGRVEVQLPVAARCEPKRLSDRM
jgi:hypothetical protein